MNGKHNKALTPIARKLRKDMTREERHLWYDFLREYPIRFLRQKVIGSYVVDFYCAAAKPGQPVSVYIKNILPDKMKIKLVIVNHSLGQSHRFDLRYFITEGHIDHWLYSTPESRKRIETDFAVAACNPG